MARNPAKYSAPGSYEVKAQRPFDDRMLVNTTADLIDGTSIGNFYYKGMLVVVANDPEVEKNGVYILTNASSLQATQDPANWQKLKEDGSMYVVVDSIDLDNKTYTQGEQTGLIPKTNVFYFVPAAREGDGNVYTEYIFNENWERIGAEDPDLTPFAKITDVEETYATIESLNTTKTEINSTLESETAAREAAVEALDERVAANTETLTNILEEDVVKYEVLPEGVKLATIWGSFADEIVEETPEPEITDETVTEGGNN